MPLSWISGCKRINHLQVLRWRWSYDGKKKSNWIDKAMAGLDNADEEPKKLHKDKTKWVFRERWVAKMGGKSWNEKDKMSFYRGVSSKNGREIKPGMKFWSFRKEIKEVKMSKEGHGSKISQRELFFQFHNYFRLSVQTTLLRQIIVHFPESSLRFSFLSNTAFHHK